MKFIYQCSYCLVNIFDIKNEPCVKSHRQHIWQVVQQQQDEERQLNNNSVSPNVICVQ